MNHIQGSDDAPDDRYTATQNLNSAFDAEITTNDSAATSLQASPQSDSETTTVISEGAGPSLQASPQSPSENTVESFHSAATSLHTFEPFTTETYASFYNNLSQKQKQTNDFLDKVFLKFEQDIKERYINKTLTPCTEDINKAPCIEEMVGTRRNEKNHKTTPPQLKPNAKQQKPSRPPPPSESDKQDTKGNRHGKKVLTQSEDEDEPKKYDHDDYDYGDGYSSAPYDSDVEDQDHNLNDADYAEEDEEEYEEQERNVKPRGKRRKPIATANYDDDEEDEDDERKVKARRKPRATASYEDEDDEDDERKVKARRKPRATASYEDEDDECKVKDRKAVARVSYDGEEKERQSGQSSAILVTPAPSARESAMKELFREIKSSSKNGRVPNRVVHLIGLLNRNCAQSEKQVQSLQSQGEENEMLKRKLQEMTTNWEMLKASKKTKKGKVSPAHAQMLKEASSAIKEKVCRSIKFHQKGWERYSTEPGSVCVMMTPYISFPPQMTEQQKEYLWNDLIAQALPRMMSSAKNTIIQRMRERFNGNVNV